MPRAGDYHGKHRQKCSSIVLSMLLLVGCKAQKPPNYEDGRGFHFVLPPGWVERARDDALPARAAHRQQSLPLPPLEVPGGPPERFLVRYDRISTGHHAWMRVSVADLPSAIALKRCVSNRLPGPGWKRESDVEEFEVSGLPAARVAFVGRWYDQDYLCETVAVRKGEKVYLFSAAFPASESEAREQARQAVLRASWQ